MCHRTFYEIFRKYDTGKGIFTEMTVKSGDKKAECFNRGIHKFKNTEHLSSPFSNYVVNLVSHIKRGRLIMKNEEIIIDFLKKQISGLAGIYIYGSFADESMRPESDIDIGFISSEKIDPVKLWEIQEQLASKLDKDVDLVDLKNVSVILRAEVIEKGIRIFTGNKYDCDYFEMVTYSLYADLNESRAEILEEVKEKYGRNSGK